MARHKKTWQIIEAAHEILSQHNPMTVRQVYYRLVSRQVIKNNRSQYQAVSKALVEARKEGLVPWEWIEDRLRRPRHVSMWQNLSNFAETAQRAYRKNVWETQPYYLEAWLEKDALSGIFEEVLRPFGVTLNVGRGYDGWDSLCKAADRYGDGEGVAVLYFGDFDPSGEDMVRSLRERLAFFGAKPEITKLALIYEDIELYQLPPDFTKTTDSRSAAFVERWGDVAVELDALPVGVLTERLRMEVKARLDMDALEACWEAERRDRERFASMLGRGA